jgi:hypothetical protein
LGVFYLPSEDVGWVEGDAFPPKTQHEFIMV